jgi:hypothetical protein
MKNSFNPFWLLITGAIVAIIYLLKKANDEFKNNPNVATYGENFTNPQAVEERAKTESPKQNASVYIKSSLLRIRDAKGNQYINSVTKQPLYFQREDEKVGEYIGNSYFNGKKYVAVKKTPETAQKWSIKGLANYNTVYLWRDAVTIK